MGHSIEPFTSISLWLSVAVLLAAIALIAARRLTRRRVASILLSAAFLCAGVWVSLDILSIGAIVGWDLTAGIGRGRLTGTAPAWSSILTEAILGPMLLLLGVVGVRASLRAK